MNVSLTVHKHTDIDSGTLISDRMVSLKYLRSRNITSSEGLIVGLKMTLVESWSIVRPGDWLVFRGPLGYALTFGYVEDVSAGVTRGGAGELSADTVQVTCISWFELIRKSHIFVPAGDLVKSVGAMFSLDDWTEKLTTPLADELTRGNIGWSLAYALKTLARIKLPVSMGGEWLGDAVRVAYDEATRLAYCPDRILEEVSREGTLPTSFTAGPMQAGIGELLQGVFYPDQTLIEMFCSLESGGLGLLAPTILSAAHPFSPAVNGLVPVDNGLLTPEEERTRKLFEKNNLHPDGDSRLAKFLGRRPVLIYRTPPWRIRPLHKSAIAKMDFRATNDEDVAQLTELVVPPTDETWRGGFLAPNRAPTRAEEEAAQAARQTRADHADLLFALYSEVTWSVSRAISIPPSAVKAFKIKWSDSDRVNIATIGLADGTKGSVEASTSAGLPITIDQSIENYGPRVARPTWPFVRSFTDIEARLPEGFTIESYLRSLAAQLMQFQVNAHLMGAGTVSMTYADVVDQEINALLYGLAPGEIMGLDLFEGVPTIFGYIDQLQHHWTRGSDGTSTAETQVTYSRATLGITEDIVRDTNVPLPEAPRQIPAKVNEVPAEKPVRSPASVRNSCAKTPGKAQPTEISRQSSILVGGVEKSVSFGVTRHILPTQAADELYDAVKAKTGEGFYTSYRTGMINNAFVHYNVGGYGSNNERLYAHFKKYYTGVAGKYALGSHFGINTDGEITQFLDAKNYANHVGTPGVNCVSVGIDLINPFSSGKATAMAAAEGGVPRWPILSGWKILSPTGGVLSTVDDFFGPTIAQQRSLNKLLHALATHVGVNLTHDAGTTTPKAFRKFSPGEITAKLASGGVWHHAQFEGNRADSLGTNITSVLAGRFDSAGEV